MRALLLVYHAGRVFLPATAAAAAAMGGAGGPTTRAQKRARLDLAQRLHAEARAAAAAAAPAARKGKRRRTAQRGRRPGGTGPAAQPPAAAADAQHVVPSGCMDVLSAVSGGGGAAAPVADGRCHLVVRRPALGMLPPELVMHILGLAAYPVSAWI